MNRERTRTVYYGSHINRHYHHNNVPVITVCTVMQTVVNVVRKSTENCTFWGAATLKPVNRWTQSWAEIRREGHSTRQMVYQSVQGVISTKG